MKWVGREGMHPPSYDQDELGPRSKGEAHRALVANPSRQQFSSSEGPSLIGLVLQSPRMGLDPMPKPPTQVSTNQSHSSEEWGRKKVIVLIVLS